MAKLKAMVTVMLTIRAQCLDAHLADDEGRNLLRACE